MKELNKKDIIYLLENLKDKRPLFCSEADFQFEFARKIESYLKNEKKYKEVKILLECYQMYKTETNPMYIDILVIIDKHWYPIELKYKTKGNYDKNYPLKYNDDNYEFVIKNHLAENINSYKYLCDIKRIEKIKENRKDKFKKGYAIMITNDSCYWNGPKKESPIYEDFIINENCKIVPQKLMNWHGASKEIINKYPAFYVTNEYIMHWKTYSKIPTEKFIESYKGKDINSVTEFKYIINEIK